MERSGSRTREVVGIVLLGVGLFLGAAVLSLQFGDGRLMGPLGRFAARMTYGLVGMGAYLVVAALALGSFRLIARGDVVRGVPSVLGALLGLVSLAVLLHIAFKSYLVASFPPGGLLGEAVAEISRAAVSTAGSVLFALVGLLLAVLATTSLEVATLLSLARAGLRLAWVGVRVVGVEIGRFVSEVVSAILPERDEDELFDDEPVFASEAAHGEHAAPRRRGKKAANDEAVPALLEAGDTVRVGEPEREPVTPEPKKKKATGEVEAAGSPAAIVTDLPEPVIVESQFHKAAKKDMDEREQAVKDSRPDFIPLGDGVYRLPSIECLKYDDVGVCLDKNAMLELSARLVKTLADYGVRGEVTAIRPGPVVTMYELAPAPGTRVAKIANLADDLAMALEAISVRIVAPIPGKAVVGIEVPNKQRETVFLKEIIADDVFQKAKSKLTIALGKDIEGRPVAVDLAKMPHLLVAGTTGAGKSVSVNAMIMSILYNATPEEVRMIMVDPKMLELSIYEGIPHLLLPVVTDPKKANLALRWAVEEMERRYELLAEAGVRDIASYNKKVDRKAQAAPAAEEVEVQIENDAGLVVETTFVESEAGEAPLGRQLELSPQKPRRPQKKLPYLVVIIDEFADLMMCAPKDVETSVARIAQKARAAGIHLILATQRPSVDVITGLIKANIPSRIAFAVSSQVDSRTILDMPGAEKLLGKGDMLFMPVGAARPIRTQGAFIADSEIQALVTWWKAQGKPVYDQKVLHAEKAGVEGEGSEDDLLVEAARLIVRSGYGSVSLLQRKMKIGYVRAARIVDQLEEKGIVGPAQGSSPREVLIGLEELDRLFKAKSAVQ
jgi:S-DNA-T family DNA segregation ATPase FtsK/SpoIIIE